MGSEPGERWHDELTGMALKRVLESTRLEAGWFHPAFLDRVPLEQLERVLARVRAAKGPFRGLRRSDGGWVADFQRGDEPVRVTIDTEGRIVGLSVGRQALRRRDPYWWAWLSRAGSIGMETLLPLVLASTMWQQRELWNWALLAALAVVLLPYLYVAGAWSLNGYWLRPVVVGGCALAAAASAYRLPDLDSGSPSWWLVGVVVVGLILGWALLGSLGAARAGGEEVRLHLPLRDGRFCVVQGGGPLLSAYARSPAMRHSVDLVKLGPLGRRCRGVLPRRLGGYHAFGIPVHSPCDAQVRRIADGRPDNLPPGADPNDPAGNFVLLDLDGFMILLAHLERGSIAVRVGERVRTGQVIARVGNSGASTEPHLHVHAERDGDPNQPGTGAAVPLRFEEHPARRLRRNDVIQA